MNVFVSEKKCSNERENMNLLKMLIHCLNSPTKKKEEFLLRFVHRTQKPANISIILWFLLRRSKQEKHT
jgi:hypothetical protein